MGAGTKKELVPFSKKKKKKEKIQFFYFDKIIAIKSIPF